MSGAPDRNERTKDEEEPRLWRPRFRDVRKVSGRILLPLWKSLHRRHMRHLGCPHTSCSPPRLGTSESSASWNVDSGPARPGTLRLRTLRRSSTDHGPWAVGSGLRPGDAGVGTVVALLGLLSVVFFGGIYVAPPRARPGRAPGALEETSVTRRRREGLADGLAVGPFEAVVDVGELVIARVRVPVGRDAVSKSRARRRGPPNFQAERETREARSNISALDENRRTKWPLSAS